MKKSIFVLSALLISLGSLAHAQESCTDKIKRDTTAVNEAERKLKVGEATRVDVIDARLTLNETNMDCGLVVKYNYCKYRQNLLATKIRIMEDLVKVGEILPSDIDAVKQSLADTVSYCTNPNAPR